MKLNRFSPPLSGKPEVALRRFLGGAAGFLILTGSLCASGLPALTSDPGDFTYDANESFTASSPSGATLSPSGFIFFGTPVASGPQQVIQLDLDGSGDACYGTSCPSSSSQFPTPNYVLPIGSIGFNAGNIVPGTGITSATAVFTLSGDITYTSPPAPTVTIPTITDTATMFTGEDPGGLSSYLYFENADGTVTNELHVMNGTSGGALITAVLVDPPGSITLDVLDFTSPGANSFLSAAPTPEPATLPLFAMAGAALVLMRRRSRKQPD